VSPPVSGRRLGIARMKRSGIRGSPRLRQRSSWIPFPLHSGYDALLWFALFFPPSLNRLHVFRIEPRTQARTLLAY